MTHRTLVLAALALLALSPSAHAQLKVGVIVSGTGPGASIGIPEKNAVLLFPKTLGGQAVEYVVTDDTTDASAASKLARRLVTEDKVDLLIGSGAVPASMAIAEVASEAHVPHIALSPLGGAGARSPWVFAVPQPAPVMMSAVADHMKASGVKTVAYIGFSDSWGDLVLSGFKPSAEKAGIKIVADERYARLDTSVAGQILKALSTHPDAVLIGGSGTPAALPAIGLAERGYKGRVYFNPGVINKDFLRVGGSNLDGSYAPTGPVMVAEQLPESNETKKAALTFIKTYEGAYGAGSRNAFAAYAYDAYLLADSAVGAASKKAAPGSADFRQALRDALEGSKDVVGTHAVYTMTATDHTGVDQRSRVMVQVSSGDWRLVK